MIKTLIVEDEQAIQKELRLLTSRSSGFHICAAAGSVAEGTAEILKHEPDLVVMDIQLQDGTAFEILDALPEKNFGIIFITAYNQFAIRALKAGAFDYLLKPLDEAEFTETLHRYLARNPAGTPEQYEATQQYLRTQKLGEEDNFCIPTTEFLQFIKLKDISYLASSGSYTTVNFTGAEALLATKSLKYFEDFLPEDLFIKIHQSHIVNRRAIHKIMRHGGLVLTDGTELPIASRRRESVIEFMLKG